MRALWHCLCSYLDLAVSGEWGVGCGEERTNSWRKEMQKCEQSKTKKKLFSLKRTFKWKCSAWLNTNNKCRQTNCIYLVNKKEGELKERIYHLSTSTERQSVQTMHKSEVRQGRERERERQGERVAQAPSVRSPGKSCAAFPELRIL